jgi:hypothetical protein
VRITSSIFRMINYYMISVNQINNNIMDLVHLIIFPRT